MSNSTSKSPAGAAVVGDVLTPDETCQILKISRVSLWRMVRDKRIPVLRLSRRLKRFRRSDILNLRSER